MPEDTPEEKQGGINIVLLALLRPWLKQPSLQPGEQDTEMLVIISRMRFITPCTYANIYPPLRDAAVIRSFWRMRPERSIYKVKWASSFPFYRQVQMCCNVQARTHCASETL